MPKLLSIAQRLLSLRGHIDITDERGRPMYEARGNFALIFKTWRITSRGREVARIRKRIFSMIPTWAVDGDLGSFEIKKAFFSWARRYEAIGGPHHGATLRGGLLDIDFEVCFGTERIARAHDEVLSIRDRHTIEIFETTFPLGNAELFTVIGMVILLLDKPGGIQIPDAFDLMD